MRGNTFTSIDEKIIIVTCLASPLFPPQSKEATQWIKHQQDSKHHCEHYRQIGRQSTCTLFTKTLAQCITMEVIKGSNMEIWGDKNWLGQTQPLSHLSLLIKDQQRGKSMVGRHDNRFSRRANINSLGGAYINMI